MTGGTADAAAVNRDLARAAQAMGVAFGVGSQRAMEEHDELAATYHVRDVAPDVVLIGNVGAVQALAMGPARVRRARASASAPMRSRSTSIPGQERDPRSARRPRLPRRARRASRGIVDGVAGCRSSSRRPAVVCRSTPRAPLLAAGVTTVDVSGAGGTSWVAVEAVRAPDGSDASALGAELWDWGLPTAVSIAACAEVGLAPIASGGLRTGLDVARAIALGAIAGGMAAPMLRAQRAGGEDGSARTQLARVIDALRTVLLLTGCRTPAELARAPRHLGAPLRAFLDDLGSRELRRSHHLGRTRATIGSERAMTATRCPRRFAPRLLGRRSASARSSCSASTPWSTGFIRRSRRRLDRGVRLVGGAGARGRLVARRGCANGNLAVAAGDDHPVARLARRDRGRARDRSPRARAGRRRAVAAGRRAGLVGGARGGVCARAARQRRSTGDRRCRHGGRQRERRADARAGQRRRCRARDGGWHRRVSPVVGARAVSYAAAARAGRAERRAAIDVDDGRARRGRDRRQARRRAPARARRADRQRHDRAARRATSPASAPR